MKKLLSTLIILILALNTVFAEEIDLTDIEGHWGRQYIEYAVNNGYASGYPDKTFKPNNPIKVDEFISLVVRTMDGFKLDTNIKSQYWATPFINYALENELIYKEEIENFQRALTREEMAMIAVRVLGKTEMIPGQLDSPIMASINDYPIIDDYMKQYVLSAYETGLISGKPNNIFDPKGTATRAETMVVIQRLKDETVRTPFILEDVPTITARYEAWTDQGWQWLPITVYAPLDKDGNRITDALDMYEHFRAEEIAQVEGTIGERTTYNPYEKVIAFSLYPDDEYLNMDAWEQSDYTDIRYIANIVDYDVREYKYNLIFRNNSENSSYFNGKYKDQLDFVYQYYFEEQADEMKAHIDRVLDAGPRTYEDRIEETYVLNNGRTVIIGSNNGVGIKITDKGYE